MAGLYSEQFEFGQYFRHICSCKRSTLMFRLPGPAA
jgi:hypothetical protein